MINYHKNLKVLELFAGIGACSKALERLGIDFEIVDAVEIDKYAIKSFNAIHGTNFEPQDITKWDKDIDVDLIMHGSPCQDFSLAGLGKGGDKGSGTRSSLMYETLRIVKKLKPKFVIWENVKNLISKKHLHNFNGYLNAMAELGYTNYYQVMNAKDYGIPQNRERIFTVSILWGRYYRFPEPNKLEKRLKDILEDNVDQRYFLPDSQTERLKYKNFENNEKGPKCLRIGGLYDNETAKYQAGSIYDIEGISATLSTMQGGNQQPIIRIKTANKKGYDIAKEGDGIDLSYPESKTRRGRVGHGVSKTIQTTCFQGTIDNFSIRRLTPKECWRLMGFDDKDFDKAAKFNSNTQLYKQAGNSIVVNVLENILKELLK